MQYGPSTIIVARKQKNVVGGIRIARRRGSSSWGLLTDLVVGEDDLLAERLIRSGERKLAKRGVRKFHGMVEDGRGLVRFFYRAGYQPKRRTVQLVWDLLDLPPIAVSPRFRIEEMDHPDLDLLVPFIQRSYQPYWTFWKESKHPEVLIRTRLKAAPRFFLAYDAGRLVGICDAKVSPEETFDWGILLSKDHPGDKIGSTLLARALEYLRDQGLARAYLTVTSGLDDYDPVVYLATLSTGATIKTEHIVLEKE